MPQLRPRQPDNSVMKTMQRFVNEPPALPAVASMYLADVMEGRGRQDLFTRQSPQRLDALRQHAIIESSVSSNRIEGVSIDQGRIAPVLVGKAALRDRDEEEVRGYRDALNLIHSQGTKLKITERTIKDLHRLTRGEIWDAGRYKTENSDILERFPDGRVRVRFRAVPAEETPSQMKELIRLWSYGLKEKRVHPVILLAAMNFDFLCIHPFRDGNGRVSRLLLLLQSYGLGLEVGRYISLERLIENNKERYYEVLAASSARWHEGKHDPWPYINFVLYTLKVAYHELESRLRKERSPRGAKTELIEAVVAAFKADFTLSELEHACPGVSHGMVKRVLRELKKSGKIKSLGRGPGAKWTKVHLAGRRRVNNHKKGQ